MFRCDRCGEMQPPRMKVHRVITHVAVDTSEDGRRVMKIRREAPHCFACAVIVTQILPSRVADMDSILSVEVRRALAHEKVWVNRYQVFEEEAAMLGIPSEQILRERMLATTAAAA